MNYLIKSGNTPKDFQEKAKTPRPFVSIYRKTAVRCQTVKIQHLTAVQSSANY